ncbi:hypothetical protein BZG02_03700 [Labilibaculum filiforme]|uniref:DUF4907 domain-containing protein n=1 Tax=Labilibaculum filiforme TaxID=1940526 RepID=A0A2N3I3T7_9BACT|nr:DUF4907 domain-containing protein [Labilibaculum filiforme]PKQ64962.1 hypothetical protein BZG02_03700 [Labilibaculum filiforme]
MIKKKQFFLIFLLLGVLLIAVYLFTNRNSVPTHSMETYKTEDGWGYKILKNNKPIINQYRIPAIQEKHAFPSEKSAKIIGEKVLERIQSKKRVSISIEDLMELMVIDSLQQPILTE